MDDDGRYSALPVRRRRRAGGPTVLYRARRVVPAADSLPARDALRSTGRERVDQVAATRLGNPLWWWRLCDANTVLSPSDLERDTARTIRLPDDAPHIAP